MIAALARLDRGGLRLLRTRFHPPAAERAARRLAFMGEYGAIWIAIALAGAALDRAPRRRWLASAAVVPAALGVNYAVKSVVRRRRPRLGGLPPLARAPTSHSFPSAHAATSFAGALAIADLAPSLGPPLLALATLIALTRPYLGLHYPSDVLAGAALGAVVASASKPWR